MAVANYGDVLNFTTATDLSTSQYLLAKQTNDTTVALATATTDVLVGPILNKPRIGETVQIGNIASGATFKVKLGGTVAVGDKITTNGSGQAVKATQTAAGSQPVVNTIGTALQVGVSGDIIEVRGGPLPY